MVPSPPPVVNPKAVTYRTVGGPSNIAALDDDAVEDGEFDMLCYAMICNCVVLCCVAR